MTPNLFVATRTLFTPHRWLSGRRKREARKRSSVRTTDHLDTPVPGQYEHIPGRGLFLIGTDASGHTKPEKPQQVVYSRVLQRNLFKQEYDARKRREVVRLHEHRDAPAGSETAAPHDSREEVGRGKDETKSTRQRDRMTPRIVTSTTRTVTKECGFFQLDDKIAWVRCWDEDGTFIPGPYERWCVDPITGRLRKMLKGDDPAWQSRRSSRSATGRIPGASTPTPTPASAVFPHHRAPAGITSASASANPSPGSSLHTPGHHSAHPVSVLDLPSLPSTRPPSPTSGSASPSLASHHFKTPIEGPVSPSLSERLRAADEARRKGEEDAAATLAVR